MPELTQEALGYRSEAETTLTAADLLLAELQDQKQREAKAKALQERLRIISSANLARSSMVPKLQIAPATSMPMIGGTAQFKSRQNRQRKVAPFGRGMLPEGFVQPFLNDKPLLSSASNTLNV